MTSIRHIALRWLAALAVALLALPALADPPARVGRLAETSGDVWIYDAASGEWIAAQRNRPITTGDRLSTDAGARAEVQLGSIAWRVDGDTDLEVARLDDAAVHLKLHRGSVAVRARNHEAARDLQVLTDEGRFAPLRAGHYRIDRDESEVVTATAWSGAINFRADDSELDVDAHQRVQFWRDDGRTHYSKLEPDRDAFADWAIAAEDAWDAERSASARHVSPEMPGIEDLDRYGRWEGSVEYGSLWVPAYVAPGWVPYRYGHWAWVGPWGWSWVDDAPWGFAPFHYGRWVHYRNRWCWAPGTYVRRPVYAPALVAWVGGPRASVSINIGSRPPAVGWFPLAPREVYVPTYRTSPVYIRNVNASHVRQIDPAVWREPHSTPRWQRYANRLVPDAVTAVAPEVIERRQPVERHVDRRVLREIEREPVSVALPVASLATRRVATPTTATVPPSPSRAGRPDATFARPRVERPADAEPLPRALPRERAPALQPVPPRVAAPNPPRTVEVPPRRDDRRDNGDAPRRDDRRDDGDAPRLRVVPPAQRAESPRERPEPPVQRVERQQPEPPTQRIERQRPEPPAQRIEVPRPRIEPPSQRIAAPRPVEPAPPVLRPVPPQQLAPAVQPPRVVERPVQPPRVVERAVQPAERAVQPRERAVQPRGFERGEERGHGGGTRRQMER